MIKTESYEDVTRITTSVTIFGKEVFSTNSYVVANLLIDTGPAKLSEQFLKVLEPFTIKTVVNTHAHSDHVGSNYAFPFVFAHPEGFERLKNPKLMMVERLSLGVPKPCSPKGVPEKIAADNFTLNVLHTPGHSPDHISLYEPDRRWAFTGDLLLRGRTREVFGDVKIYDAIESLRLLSKMDIEILFPGHGPPVKNPNAALRTQIETLETFGTQIRIARERGLDAEEIRDEIFGKERMLRHLSGGKFSALNLVNSYLKNGKRKSKA